MILKNNIAKVEVPLVTMHACSSSPVHHHHRVIQTLFFPIQVWGANLFFYLEGSRSGDIVLMSGVPRIITDAEHVEMVSLEKQLSDEDNFITWNTSKLQELTSINILISLSYSYF
nr:alpha-ketoglutarate-dependent dioxygenase AlkB [Tanacetum cinerariifolium]